MRRLLALVAGLLIWASQAEAQEFQQLKDVSKPVASAYGPRGTERSGIFYVLQAGPPPVLKRYAAAIGLSLRPISPFPLPDGFDPVSMTFNQDGDILVVGRDGHV